MDLATIEREALSLPPAERATLANELLASLENLSEAELEELWILEVKRRAKEVDDGLVETIPAEEVFKMMEARLR